MKRQHSRRLHEWEPFDEVRMRVVPRYKTSGLSGDEWRTGVVCELLFKGEVVADTFWSSMEVAATRLAAFMDDSACPIPERVIEIEAVKCFQPSCKNDSVATYLLKRLTSRQGEYLAESEHYCDSVRRFCRVHLRRGDCSREDCDENYEVIDGPGPESSSNVQESPAAQVVVDLRDVED